eukprot:SAG31_NODE_7307_length_1724_cov_1.358154_2_plen_102_part_00
MYGKRYFFVSNARLCNSLQVSHLGIKHVLMPKVLGLAAGSVGASDSFFELGGHSSSAVEVCRKLQDQAAAAERAGETCGAADWSLHDIRVRCACHTSHAPG